MVPLRPAGANSKPRMSASGFVLVLLLLQLCRQLAFASPGLSAPPRALEHPCHVPPYLPHGFESEPTLYIVPKVRTAGRDGQPADCGFSNRRWCVVRKAELGPVGPWRPLDPTRHMDPRLRRRVLCEHACRKTVSPNCALLFIKDSSPSRSHSCLRPSLILSTRPYSPHQTQTYLDPKPTDIESRL